MTDRPTPTTRSTATEPTMEVGCPHGAWGMVVPCPSCGSPRHVSPSRFVTDRFLAEVERGEREWPAVSPSVTEPPDGLLPLRARGEHEIEAAGGWVVACGAHSEYGCMPTEVRDYIIEIVNAAASTEQATRNEAADYLRAIHAGTYRAQKLDEALATERRNVVEQVREALFDCESEPSRTGLGFTVHRRVISRVLDSIATGTEEEGK